MSAAPRLAWGRGGVSPSAPATEPRSKLSELEAGTPFSAKHGQHVWFLDDVFTLFTHWIGSTMPCVPDDETGVCPLCRKRVKASRHGFAAVLLKHGTDGLYQPRVLRVPSRNVDQFGDNQRGRRYSITQNKAGNGARLDVEFRFVKFREPPIEAFDARQIMQNTWYPQYATQIVVPPEVWVTDDTVLSPVAKEKTRAEQLAELSDADLVAHFKRMQGGPVKSWADEALAEIERREIRVDGPDPTRPAGKGDKFHVGVYTAPVVDGPVAAERKRGAA